MNSKSSIADHAYLDLYCEETDMSKTKAVFGIMPTETAAIQAADALKAAGFTADDISALFPDRSGTKDFAHEQNTKAPEGAATGAGVGGALGGGLGWLAGIGTLAIPGVGPLIAAGPIMAALSGAAAGAMVGGLTGALIGMGIPEIEAKRYEGKIKGGNILLSVHAESSKEISRAKKILKDAGADDISHTEEASVSNATSDDSRMSVGPQIGGQPPAQMRNSDRPPPASR